MGANWAWECGQVDGRAEAQLILPPRLLQPLWDQSRTFKPPEQRWSWLGYFHFLTLCPYTVHSGSSSSPTNNLMTRNCVLLSPLMLPYLWDTTSIFFFNFRYPASAFILLPPAHPLESTSWLINLWMERSFLILSLILPLIKLYSVPRVIPVCQRKQVLPVHPVLASHSWNIINESCTLVSCLSLQHFP